MRNDTHRRAREFSPRANPSLDARLPRPVRARRRRATLDMRERDALLFEATLAERVGRAEGAVTCRRDVSRLFERIARRRVD